MFLLNSFLKNSWAIYNLYLTLKILTLFLIFLIIVNIQYHFVLVSGAQHMDLITIRFSKCSPQYFQYPPGTIHSYYNIIDYIPYAVFYIPMTVL